MKRTLLALAVAVGSGIAIGAATAQSAPVVVSAADGQDRIIHRGGTVRVGKTVYLHTNGTHAAVGLTKIQLVNNCYLRVFFDTSLGEQAISLVVDEDEALSRLGVRAGGSGGIGYANIYLYTATGRPICANNPTLGPYANIWIAAQDLAPAAVDPADLKPAPVPNPPLAAQQKSVPSVARATVTPPR